MSEQFDQQVIVPDELGAKRFDQIAAICFPDFSRARLQEWIKSGALLVNDAQRKAKDKLVGGETLSLSVVVEDEERWIAEDIPLNIIYEDDVIMVVNKPAGLVVHPAAGNRSGTLLNGLLHYCPDLASVPRAGIVHRLDKDTTGLMVVAKTLAAHTDLVGQLQERTVSREYEAITYGVMTSGGTVNEPIGRHPTNRLKMAVVAGGKPSVTHFRVLEKFRSHTHIRCQLETGRTHQIRVHMGHIRFPLFGDETYAGRLRLPKNCPEEMIEHLRSFGRQALHARRLGLIHPATDEPMEWEAPLPADMISLLDLLRDDLKASKQA